MRNRFILVADTSDAFLDMLRVELATTNYAMLQAKNGQEAIDYLELLHSEIILAIVKLELPVVSGLDVIWRLMRRKQPEPTKFIATSSVDVPLIEKVVKEPGVEAVVRVPMPMQDWRKLIAAVLGGELSGHPTARVPALPS